MTNVSFSAHTSVAVLTGHTPAKASYTPRQGGLEIPLGQVAAEDALSGGSSLPRVELRDLESALLHFDQLGVALPESFLSSLRSVLGVSTNQAIAVVGASVTGSLASVCLEGLGPSRGWGTLLCTLREFVGVASPSVDPVGLCPGDSLGSLGVSSSSAPSLFPSSDVYRVFLSSWFPLSPVFSFLSFFWHLSSSSGAPPAVPLSSGSSMAPPVPSLPPFSSVAPRVTSLSHPVSALLVPVISSSLPVVSSLSVVSSSLSVASSSFILSVASSTFPDVAFAFSAGVAPRSSSTGSSWSLPSAVVCSAPLAPSLPPSASSFLPSFSFAGSSSFPTPPVSSFSFANPVASTVVPLSALPGGSRSSPGVGSGVGPSPSARLAGPRISVGDRRGTSGTACSFSDVDPKFDKGDKESPLAKGEFSKSFQELIALITSYFPALKPSVSSDSDSWLDVFGNVHRRSPHIFVNLFEKLAAIHKEVDSKFLKAADEKKKASSSLPPWSEVYQLGNLDKFHKAPCVNESFSRLWSKTVFVALRFSFS